MKLFFFLTIVYLFLHSFSAQSQDTITNQTISDLHSAGLGREVLISKINSSYCNFELSTNSLIKLKKTGIPDEVLALMVSKSSSSNSSNENSGDKLLSLTPGIYYCNNNPCNYQELEASVYSSANQGSGILTSLTYGIAKTKNKAILSGVKSNFDIKETSPVFYFIFDKTSSNNFGGGNGQIFWFSAATSPNEFILVKFTSSSNKKSREVITGTWNSYEGLTTGIDDKNKISFKFEKISKGVYKVITEKPLEDGQYCFMYAGGTSTFSGAPMQKVFDFGISVLEDKKNKK
ncbi:MAG: hypothetical protein K2X48_04845 [Chitinophagaceae bacterium]|nr:hypothetical protein [Chitinophagaceae bacterium]